MSTRSLVRRSIDVLFSVHVWFFHNIDTRQVLFFSRRLWQTLKKKTRIRTTPLYCNRLSFFLKTFFLSKSIFKTPLSGDMTQDNVSARAALHSRTKRPPTPPPSPTWRPPRDRRGGYTAAYVVTSARTRVDDGARCNDNGTGQFYCRRVRKQTYNRRARGRAGAAAEGTRPPRRTLVAAAATCRSRGTHGRRADDGMSLRAASRSQRMVI